MKQTIASIAACLAALLSGTAQAAAGSYAFVDAGRSHYNNDCTGVRDCKSNDTAFRLGGGYRSSSGLAGELVYFNFGKTSGRDNVSGVFAEIKADAVGIGGAFHADFTPEFTGVVRLGVASVQVRATGRLGSVSVDFSERSTKAYVGVGLTYAFTPGVYGEIGFDATNGKLEGESSRITALTAGIGVRF